MDRYRYELNNTISIHCIPGLKRHPSLIMVTIMNIHDIPRYTKILQEILIM